MTQVHPTAVVSPGAELGEGVVVGPYAVIEGGAVIGAGTSIDAHVIVKGSVTLGRHCRVHGGAILGDDPQDLAFPTGIESRVILGDRTVVREQVTVHRATNPDRPTRIGDDCLLMAQSHVAHDCQISDHVVLCNGALVAGHVEIGQRAFISGNTVVHQFCRVGAVVMLSGISGIGRDVGPYLTVAGRSEIGGVNVVGLRRAGLKGEQRMRIKQAYRALFASSTLAAGMDEVRALGVEQPEVRAIIDFYAGSKRGFSRPPRGHVFGG